MKLIKSLTVAVALSALIVPAAGVSADSAIQPTTETSSAAHWWWDEASDVGTSVLKRGQNGLVARFTAHDIAPGSAVTLWFIVFNNPDACSTSPCRVPEDVFDPATQADFYPGGGHVVGGGGTVTIAGRLAVGSTRGSGKEEIGMGPGVPLTNPYGAEVVLALHSHGPMVPSAMPDQINSYLGGCTTFNGPNGFAAGPGDVPDAVGECSTFVRSLHR